MKRTNTHISKSDNNDFIYYNFNLTNNSDISTLCQITENLNDSITEDGKDYYLSTIRFVLDGSSIPIFIFKDGQYWVTLRYNGIDYSQPVLYVPFDNEFGGQTVYSFTAFLEMVNIAFATAYALIPGAPAGGKPPYMLFDPVRGTCPLYAPTGYVTTGVFPIPDVPVINIYMNSRLFGFFNNFFANFLGEGNANHKDYEIIVRDLHTSNTNARNPSIPPNYYMMSNEYNSTYSWFDITSIVFNSNTLGVKPEYVPIKNTTTSLTTNNAAGSGPASSSMLTDFQPYLAPGDCAGIRGYNYYTPTAQYRYMNIMKDQIATLDLSVILRDRIGNQYPYYVPPWQSIQVKIVFSKRGLCMS